jgi:hypothetical protein
MGCNDKWLAIYKIRASTQDRELVLFILEFIN